MTSERLIPGLLERIARALETTAAQNAEILTMRRVEQEGVKRQWAKNEAYVASQDRQWEETREYMAQMIEAAVGRSVERFGERLIKERGGASTSE